MATSSRTQAVFYNCWKTPVVRSVHTCKPAVAFIRGRRLFHSAPPIVGRLFEAGVYSSVASIRGNMVSHKQFMYARSPDPPPACEGLVPRLATDLHWLQTVTRNCTGDKCLQCMTNPSSTYTHSISPHLHRKFLHLWQGSSSMAHTGNTCRNVYTRTVYYSTS